MTGTHYDVIIIGTGAGGGTLAHRLAPSGARILLLERGGFVPREKDNWNPQAVNVAAKYHTKESWTTPDGHALHPHTNYYVGGNPQVDGAALFRFREADFGELAHHGGISPAWPITYADL
jgi:choline dehydrogenase-like flavoprotein